MPDRNQIIFGAMVAAAGALMASAAAAFDDAQYPDLTGAWNRAVQAAPRFDPSKERGKQAPPLTAEYQAIFEANLKDMAAGGQGNHTVYTCLAWGMPAMMNAYEPIEFVITPETTYLMIDDGNDSVRRVFTDGRDFPTDAEPTYVGYSIGKWLDTDGDGKFDTLEVETRNFKGPRVYDNSGLILHPDNESIIKERIHLDKTEPNLLVDEMTVTDHALTRPVVGGQDLQARTQSRLARGRVRRGQQSGPHRQGELHAERGRRTDAGEEEPVAAGPALFPANQEVTKFT